MDQEMASVPAPAHVLQDYLHNSKATLESMMRDRYMVLGPQDKTHMAAMLTLYELEIAGPDLLSYNDLVERVRSWWKMTKNELVAKARTLGLPTEGSKHEILTRLAQSLKISNQAPPIRLATDGSNRNAASEPPSEYALLFPVVDINAKTSLQDCTWTRGRSKSSASQRLGSSGSGHPGTDSC